ncbi:MAG: hypothetical protein M1818_004012 [Claussenomyces sp. TS43310]|nr:MAG: hypothetical protein M1818_004012 [Claussenomyces sp. TS43310]
MNQGHSADRPSGSVADKAGDQSYKTSNLTSHRYPNADSKRSETKPRSHIHHRYPDSSSLYTHKSTNSETGPIERNHDSQPRPWPPTGFSHKDELSSEEAEDVICKGTPTFHGRRIANTHISEDHFSLYALPHGSHGLDADCGSFYAPAFRAMTLQLYSSELAARPWHTIEQPSLAFSHGVRNGTITLNQWVTVTGQSQQPRTPNSSRAFLGDNSGVRLLDVELNTICHRLSHLESDLGQEEASSDMMYKRLYTTLLRDPDKYLRPHKTIERQIADLVFILSDNSASGAQWIDFSDPRHQVIAKYLFNTQDDMHKIFFHQLLLSIELDLRIKSNQHSDISRDHMISQLPPRVAWDLALARRWQDCASIVKSTGNSEVKRIQCRLSSQKHQVNALVKFATAMDWPTVTTVKKFLRSEETKAWQLEDLTSDSISYLSSLLLPGPSLPFLLMNTLIECDNGIGTNLSALTHLFPASGFQYRTRTYWSSKCIVGKVLAPTCREICEWIGPGRATPDLEATEIARIVQRKTKHILQSSHVQNMKARSQPLGLKASTYPVEDYQMVLPDLDNFSNRIRIGRLSLKAVAHRTHRSPRDSPRIFEAFLEFTVDSEVWPLRLAYDVSFIYACPCSQGPHPLFFDYVYKAVKASELLRLLSWGVDTAVDLDTHAAENTAEKGEVERSDDAVERVLVIEAFGVVDNEVFSRGWCAHWGLSSIVADVNRTW